MNEDDEDEDKPRGLKKRKGGKNGGKTKKVGHEKKVEKVDSEALGYFNPEDEIFAKVSCFFLSNQVFLPIRSPLF